MVYYTVDNVNHLDTKEEKDLTNMGTMKISDFEDLLKLSENNFRYAFELLAS